MQENSNSNEQSNATTNAPAHNSRHKVRCIDHKWARASTGNKQIAILCEVTEGPHKGFMSTWYGVMAGDASEYTERGMRALGFKGDNILDMRSMYEGEALATFEHDKNKDGKPIVKIAWLNDMGVIVKDELTGADLQHFAQEMRAYLGNKRNGGSTSAAGAQTLPPMGNGHDQRQQSQQGWNGYQQPDNGQQRSQQRRDDIPPPSEAPPWATRGDNRGGGNRDRW